MKNQKSARLKLVVDSGSLKGKVFTFDNGDELILGRGKYSNLVIDDKQASRRHARIYAENGNLFIEDLDSINGTFVNGKGVETRQLVHLDSVEIANLRIQVVSIGEVPGFMRPIDDDANEDTTATKLFVLSTPLTENALFEMINHLANEGKTGTLIVRVGWGTGRIFIHNGHLITAEISSNRSLNPRKAVQRLLRATSGSLQFSPGETMDSDEVIHGDIGSIRDEDKSYGEEFIRLVKLMPAFDANFVVNEPVDASSLTPTQREILQSTKSGHSLTPTLDQFSGADSMALKTLAELIEKGILSF